MDSLNIVLHPALKVLYYAIDIYIWVVAARVILSWLLAFDVINRHNQVVASVGRFVWRVTEPVLFRIRRLIPAVGGLDLSPLILFLVLFGIQQIIVEILIRTV